jgi:hypothetical protein
MANIFLQPFIYPTSESELNSDNHNIYIDDVTNEFVGINETTGAEVFRIGGGGATTPKVYRALISQQGTENLVMTVLENSLGFVPEFIRTQQGVYQAVIPDVTTNDRVYLSIGNTGAYADLSASASFYAEEGYDSTATIVSRVYGGANNQYADDKFSATSFEMLIYP